MNVLVTGATGRVGSRFVPRLLQQRGVSVSVLVRRPERAESLRRLGAQVVQGDLLQRDTLTKALERIDTIVHLAAFFRGATDAEAHEVNDTGTEMLAERIPFRKRQRKGSYCDSKSPRAWGCESSVWLSSTEKATRTCASSCLA